jgi:DNA replication protein DnaC
VLLLDDLGTKKVTEWVEDTVTAIITYRCNQRKPLIATTNLTDNDNAMDLAMGGGEKKTIREKTLGEMIGFRARSRLHEMCRVVHMPRVEDYRVKGAR